MLLELRLSLDPFLRRILRRNSKNDMDAIDGTQVFLVVLSDFKCSLDKNIAFLHHDTAQRLARGVTEYLSK